MRTSLLLTLLAAGRATAASGKGRDHDLPPIVTQKYPAWTLTGMAYVAQPQLASQKTSYGLGFGVERLPVYYAKNPGLELTPGSHEGDIGIALEYGALMGFDLVSGSMLDARFGLGLGMRDRATQFAIVAGSGTDWFGEMTEPDPTEPPAETLIVPGGYYAYYGLRLVTGFAPWLAVRFDAEVDNTENRGLETRWGSRALILVGRRKLEAGFNRVHYEDAGTLTMGSCGFSF